MKAGTARIVAAAAMLGSVAMAAPASAAPTIYTDRAAFRAAAGTTVFESFEQPRASAATQAFQGFSLSETNGTNSVILDDFLGATDGRQTANITDNGNSLFRIDFTAPIQALGFDLASNVNSTVTISGAVSTSLTLAALRFSFFGVIDTAGFTNLTLDASGNPAGFGIDSLDYSTSVPAVAAAAPEPGTWAMMIVGFGAAGGALRRRRKVATRVSFAV